MDTRGNIVATTEKGKLVFLKGRKKKAGEEERGQVRGRAVDPQAKAKAAPAPQAAPRAKEGDPEGGGGASEDTLTIVFGRFNPPTVGHEKLLQAAEKAAIGGELKIYPSRTNDPKKNPIDPDMKISYMKKMFPDYEEQIINDPEMVSIFNVLVTAAEDGYKNINIVVGADRQAEFENLANKYNGELYDFKEIRVISAGVRDADAEGVEGMSASKMRKAVQDDDFDAFRRGMPKKLNNADTQALFDAVRTGMGTKKKKKNVTEVWQIAPRIDQKGLRENYVKGLIYRIGDIVESLNTGLIGKIIRRGTNHLICVTEEDYMFKSWIRDVMEYTEKRMERRMRVPGKPNTLDGTGGYRKNAQASVAGQKKIKNFDIKEFLNKYRKKTTV
jgi:nicotinamide mononucleotide adenylyltransferase